MLVNFFFFFFLFQEETEDSCIQVLRFYRWLVIHQWVSEFVTQYWFSMYYKLWNIRKLTSHYFSDCSLNHGTFKKAKWQLGSKCSSSYSTLKTSIALRIQTPTGDPSGLCLKP